MSASALDGFKPELWRPLIDGADYGEVFLEESSVLSVHFEDSKVEEFGTGTDAGAGIRFLRKRGEGRRKQPLIETLFGSVNKADPGAVARIRSRLLQGQPPREDASSAENLGHFRHPVSIDPAEVPTDAKVLRLVEVDRTVRSEFPHIRQVSMGYSERSRSFVVMNSEGSLCRESRKSIVMSIRVTAERDGLLQTGYEVIGGLKGYELLDDYDPIRCARIAARRALAKLDAPVAMAGEMAVVLSSTAGGTFVHEAIGHSLEADHVQEGTSPAYKDKIGQAVAPENLTIVDDPTLPFCRGSYAADDEGTPARPTPVVENGVLRDYLYDRLTSMKSFTASNGHGRRESYHHRPIPRMSNLYIAPGKDDPRKIVEELSRGLFVTKMGGGQVDTATGEFVFEVEEGFWVEGGQVRHMVRDANLLGVGPAALKSIDRLGWDIGWGIGTCGKDGQGVPVSDGQPTLRIPRLLIGGRNE